MVVVVVPVRMVVVRLGRRLRRLGLHRYRLRRARDPICERVDAGDERPLQSCWNPGLLPKDLVPKSGCEALRAAALPVGGGTRDRRRLRSPLLRERGRQPPCGGRLRTRGAATADGCEHHERDRDEPQYLPLVPVIALPDPSFQGPEPLKSC